LTLLVIAASGFPDYTARLVRQLIQDFDGRVEVVATRPDVPVEGMEKSLGKSVHWITPADRGIKWDDLGLRPPDYLLLGGFFVPSFWALSQQVRQAGGHLFLASDNNWTGSFRQKFLDNIRHRLMLRRHFSGVMTAGRSGIKYSSAMGYPSERIVPGMYGADPALFFDGPPITERPKTFIYIGRLIRRKNVLGLARAFAKFHEVKSDWTLEMYGEGPDREEIPEHPAIKVHQFLQPKDVSEKLRNARCLVLPSRQEHWGVVVHEAALSGCALALSNSIGSLEDFATPGNAVTFPSNDEEKMAIALHRIAGFSEDQWAIAQSISRERGTQFGPKRFSAELRQLIDLTAAALRPNQSKATK